MAKGTMRSVGGRLDDFLAETGEREEVYGAAIKRVLALQLETIRRDQAISKSDIATKLGTSRTQINRILDPDHVSVSLDTLDRMARVLGKRLKVELMDA